MTSQNKESFHSAEKARLSRLLFFGSVIVVNLVVVLWMADLFWKAGFHRAHVPILFIFTILNGLLTLGSFHALFGAFEILKGRKRSVRITELGERAGEELEERYAVVMPVYNEDAVKFCARIEGIYRTIEEAGEINRFDFFILSDTRDLDSWIKEEVAWTNLCRRLDGFGKIYYRRRRENENRKAGNIGDFVRTWGGGYEGMLVLDADSLMDGKDIVKMARVMEAYPKLGILQTAPRLIRGVSSFTRLQQFAMRLYGPLFIRGLNFWQLGGGSYWGHNALIRVKPFSEFCELPALPGKEPFGGRILSHDFVEAALMVSQGWEVWLAWDIEGSYEEAPPTLVDHLKRDRRWAQGNLQHMWLLFARKLPLTVRIHLFMGIMAYLGSPLWFLFLAMGTWLAWDFKHSDLSILPFESNVERWFGIGGHWQGLILIIFVFTLLFLPKILSVLGALSVPRLRHAFGGGVPLLLGGLLETVVSTLLAPCIMLAHTGIVLSVISGKAVGWGTQSRETDGTAWGDAMRFHAIPTLFGVAWTVLAFSISTNFVLWMSPILLGLLLSVPVSVFTSRASLGGALRKKKILSIPEELEVPRVLEVTEEAGDGCASSLSASSARRDGVLAAVVDPYVNGMHVSLLEDATLKGTDKGLAENCLRGGTRALSSDELTRLLYLAPAMVFMHRAVWLGQMEGIDKTWNDAVESYRKLESPLMG